MSAVATSEHSKALTVLRETVSRPPAYSVSGTGARMVSVLRSTGWNSFNVKSMTTDQILRLPGVIICLDVLSQDIAKTPLILYERLPNNGKRQVEATEHHMAMLLATQPNRFHTWQEFIELLMNHLGVVQNAYIAKRLDAAGRPTELIPAMPARVTQFAVMPEDDPINGMGFFFYRVDRNTPAERLQFAKLDDIFLQSEFIHLRGRMFDGLMGYSNLDIGARLFGLTDELTSYQTRLFGSDGQMPGVFQKPGEAGDALSNEAFDRLREQLKEASRKFREESAPIVLEEGLTFKDVAMNAEQAELSKARDAALVDTARLWRIPPHKIMHLVNVKYENMETLEKSYVNDTLVPYCRRIEQRFNRELLTAEDRARYFFEFDRRAMLLNDMQKLAEVGKVGVQIGGLELDEFRQLFGYNKLPNKAGEVRTIPSTYNTVDRSNEVIIPAGAQPQGDEKSGDDDDAAAAKKDIDNADS